MMDAEQRTSNEEEVPYETAGLVTVYRPWPWRYRAECPCGWNEEGTGHVRGRALWHGLHCGGATSHAEDHTIAIGAAIAASAIGCGGSAPETTSQQEAEQLRARYC